MKCYKPTKLQQAFWILELGSSFICNSEAFVQHRTITYSLRVHHWFHMGVYLSCLGLMKTKGLQGALKDDLPLSEKTKLAS